MSQYLTAEQTLLMKVIATFKMKMLQKDITVLDDIESIKLLTDISPYDITELKNTLYDAVNFSDSLDKEFARQVFAAIDIPYVDNCGYYRDMARIKTVDWENPDQTDMRNVVDQSIQHIIDGSTVFDVNEYETLYYHRLISLAIRLQDPIYIKKVLDIL